ncbi:MAG: hypothetical protein AAGL24_10170 [Pseudomonadota bacterium]
MAMEYKTGEWKEFGYYGNAEYRVHTKSDGFQAWQRHEWKTYQGTHFDPWIRSTLCIHETLKTAAAA